MNTPRRSRKGSLIGVTLVFALVLAAVGASYISMTTTNLKVAHANFTHHALLNPVESGADRAMLTLSNYLAASCPGGTWTNTASGVWTASGTGYSRLLDKKMALGNGRTATVKVTVQNVPTLANQGLEPYVIVEALANSSANGASVYSRQVALKLKGRSLFDNGMVAVKTIDLKGNVYKIDSYLSTKGAYNNPVNRTDNVTVSTLSVLNGINATGGTIFGNVAAAPGSTVGGVTGTLGNAHVYGTDSPAAYQAKGIDPTHVATDFTASYPLKTYTATGGTTSLANPSSSITLGTAGTTKVYTLSQALNLSKNKITIAGNVIILADKDISISGQGGITIPATGTLKIYTSANVSITGNGITNVNATGTGLPQNCFVYGTNPSSQSISVAGNGAFSGVIYAPNASVSISGGGSGGVVNGAIVANTITCNGGVDFHYDEALSQITEPGFTLESWVELTGANKIAMTQFGL